MKLITTGCSFAGHTTHPLIEEESWSVQLTKRLNLNKSQVLNMGLGGCSLDYIYRSVIHGAIENLNKDLVVLHPGPINRGVEISSDVADGDNAIILDQVLNGVAVRMSVLFLLLSSKE